MNLFFLSVSCSICFSKLSPLGFLRHLNIHSYCNISPKKTIALPVVGNSIIGVLKMKQLMISPVTSAKNSTNHLSRITEQINMVV